MLNGRKEQNKVLLSHSLSEPFKVSSRRLCVVRLPNKEPVADFRTLPSERVAHPVKGDNIVSTLLFLHH